MGDYFLSADDECRQLFARVITTDAACRGFDPVSNGIAMHFRSGSFSAAFCMHMFIFDFQVVFLLLLHFSLIPVSCSLKLCI